MKLFGLEITRQKKLEPVSNRGWFRIIREPFTGAWQQNAETLEERANYPTLYACLQRIAADIGKLPFVLKRNDGGIWEEVQNAAYSPVLRKPNQYQTAQQFREAWVLSKLTNGNAYILKVRDARNVVIELHVLDPNRVKPAVSDSGAVFYQLDYASGNSVLPERFEQPGLTLPASEIIHDRMHTLYHPLIGLPPLSAAAIASGKNLNILKSSQEFFGNNAQPGGLLTAPAGLSDADADAIKAYWDTNFTGESRGKIGVIGADMKYTPFAFKAADSQLVEQMRYSDEQICQPFGIPPFKVGIGSLPAGMKVDDLNQLYYGDALQPHIEAMEYLLDEGLAITAPLGVEADLEPLLRMDVGKQAEVESKLVGSKIKTPDEARRVFGLRSTGGGDTLWGQNQDYPLGMLADRATWDPQMQPAPEPEPPPEPEDPEDITQAVRDAMIKAMETTDATEH